MCKNWKTTAAGIAGLLSIAAAVLGGIASGHWDIVVGALSGIPAAISGLLAKDATP